MTQLELGEVVGHVGPRTTIAEDFRRFHEANPHVYRDLVHLARIWRRRGRERVGIGMLFEVLRWRIGMSTAGDDFKLNNNYRACYARLMMEQEPDLAGVFEIRQLGGGTHG